MEQYKDFWIASHARPGPPYTQYWNPSGAVYYQRLDNSIVELERFTLEFFDIDDRGVAELFGLEVARLVVDTGSPELVAGQRVMPEFMLK
ncbi:MAG: hypothetical protein M3N35_13540 [Candidatus Binatota bacterium]|nr:hypothetical protein [Candidatus Binatota bacterium]